MGCVVAPLGRNIANIIQSLSLSTEMFLLMSLCRYLSQIFPGFISLSNLSRTKHFDIHSLSAILL